MMFENDVIIGVDPAFRKNGFAVCRWDLKLKLMTRVIFNKISEYLVFINAQKAQCAKEGRGLWIGVEDASLEKKALYGLDPDKIVKTAIWTKQKHGEQIMWGFLKKKIRSLATTAKSAGMVISMSDVTADLAESLLGVDRVFRISPSQKGAKIEDPKIFFAYLKSSGVKVTQNYKPIKSQQDFRDAAKIAVQTKERIRLKFLRSSITK